MLKIIWVVIPPRLILTLDIFDKLQASVKSTYIIGIMKYSPAPISFGRSFSDEEAAMCPSSWQNRINDKSK